jgi:hypothetical protein
VLFVQASLRDWSSYLCLHQSWYDRCTLLLQLIGWDGVLLVFCPGWPWITAVPISASSVAGVMGTRHTQPGNWAILVLLYLTYSLGLLSPNTVACFSDLWKARLWEWQRELRTINRGLSGQKHQCYNNYKDAGTRRIKARVLGSLSCRSVKGNTQHSSKKINKKLKMLAQFQCLCERYKRVFMCFLCTCLPSALSCRRWHQIV